MAIWPVDRPTLKVNAWVWGAARLAGMDDDHPWEWYEKDQLPSGFTYPVGRDAVEVALTAAGARIGALYFTRPKLNPPNDPPIVIRIHWPGSGRMGYYRARDDLTDPTLIMWVDAVPSEHRAAIRTHLEAGTLARACRWVADLMSDPENPALLAERELYVTWSGTGLTESSTWPPKGSDFVA
jgi:hypothetical protein